MVDDGPSTGSAGRAALRELGVLARAVHRRVAFTRTVHALPFLGIGAALALRGWPPLGKTLLLLACVVFARAMVVAVLRCFEAPPDVTNPRTAADAEGARAPPLAVWATFAAHAAAVLVVCAYLLDPLAGHLSWGLVGASVVYAALRRFTGLAHFILGAGLAAGPQGAWIALRGGLEGTWPALCLLSLGILLWVAGFDMVYALALRRTAGPGRPPFARPLRFSERAVRRIAAACHAAAVGAFALVGPAADLGWAFAGGPAVAVLGLLRAHVVLRRKPDAASAWPRFRRLNLVTGPALFVATVAAL